jgi:hypothetical protein
MKTPKILLNGVVLIVTGFFINPLFVSAHEVYVLDSASIANDISQPSLNLFKVALSHEYLFLFCLFLGLLGVLSILGISLSRKIESWIDPILLKIKPYAGHIAQITLGAALIASAYYGALFGTELPLQTLFGTYAFMVTLGLYFAGALLVLGMYPRLGGLIAIVAYSFAFAKVGVYMLSYMTYFGEALVTLLFGGGYVFLTLKHPWGSGNLISAIQKRKHFLLRIAFSISLIYAALYAKLIHGALALDTVTKYHLTNYFHFDPLFIVLGAFLVEMTIGIFYLIGFEIRFTSLFFLTFLTMSLLFFGESVWPHIVLIGTAITMFLHGYDEFTIEHPWYRKGKREPVL